MSRRAWAGALVVGVAALSIGLSTDLRSPPRYDGAGYSVLGLALQTGLGYREIDRPDAPPHDHFPPGYPLALAGLWSIAGRSVVAAHGLSIACTVVATWLAWRWLRRIEPPAVANLLGLALAANSTWAAVGGSIQSEPFYLMLSMAVLVLARRTGIRAALGLGALIGLCTLTRHVGICLLAAVVIDRISLVGSAVRTSSVRRSKDQEVRTADPTRGRFRLEVALMGLTAAVVIAPWVYWLATVRRNTQVGLIEAGGIGARVAGQALFYARRVPDALTGPFVEVATVFSRSRAVGWVATGAAVVVSTVILAGLIRATRDPRKRLAGLVPLVTLPVLLVWPFTEAGRFLIPLVPCLLVGMVEGLSGIGLWLPRIWRSFSPQSTPHPNPPPQRGRGPDQAAGSWGIARWGATPRKIAAALVLVAGLPYPCYSLMTGRARAQRQTHADFDAACAWIARHADRPGPVMTRHPGEVYWQTGRQAVTPVGDDLDAIEDQIRAEGVAYLLIDPDRFANAPTTPLARFAGERRARKVFAGAVEVYEIPPR